MRVCAASLGGLLALVVISSASVAAPAINAAESSVRLGLTAGYGNYEENVQPQDMEAGTLLGFEAGVSSLSTTSIGRFGWPDFYANVTYDFLTRLFRYRGNVQNAESTVHSAHDGNYYNTVIVRLGLGRPLSGNTEIIPYAAGGYQNWYRNVAGPAGYGEFYQTGLIGGGLKVDVAATPFLVVSAAAEGFAVIGGTVSVPSQNFSGNFGTSAEERVSLDADYRLNSSWHLFAGLGVTHYNYSGLKPNFAGVYESLSTTLQVDSTLGLAYGF